MTAVHPRRPARRYGPPEDPAVTETDALLSALSRGEPLPGSGRAEDPAVALLAALIDDVDQRRSSVSITPST